MQASAIKNQQNIRRGPPIFSLNDSTPQTRQSERYSRTAQKAFRLGFLRRRSLSLPPRPCEGLIAAVLMMRRASINSQSTRSLPYMTAAVNKKVHAPYAGREALFQGDLYSRHGRLGERHPVALHGKFPNGKHLRIAGRDLRQNILRHAVSLHFGDGFCSGG